MVEPLPDPSSAKDGAESVFLRWLAEHERGDPSGFDDLCARHPALAARLAALRAAHAQADEVLARLVRPVAPHSETLPPELAWADVSAPPRYELKGEIARGGMGTIFEVYDPSLRRTVAMKVLRRDRTGGADTPATDLARRQSRLLSEAQILAQLDHPGVVAIHEMGLDEKGRAYFTMKRVRGQDLGDVIRAHHAGNAEWKLARLVGVLVRVCEAVAYAHQKGVIHRDLKPSNVLVGRFGEVFVMDWGLAKALGRTDAPPVPLVHAKLGPDPEGAAARERPAGDDLADTGVSLSLVHTDRDLDSSSTGSSPLATLAGEVVGTPPYMPPEQARGEIEALDARVDVYAVGAMLYHVLVGKHPYGDSGAKNGETLLACVLSGPPTPLESLAPRASEELVAICEKAMARDPAQRYPTMLALADELRAYLEGRVVRAHRTGALVELRKWTRRNRWAAATIGVVVVALAAGAIYQTLVGRELETRAREISARAEDLRRKDYVNRMALASDAWRDGKVERMAQLLAGAPADLRRWEWRFLEAQLDTSDDVIALPDDTFRGAARTPDGRRVVTVTLPSSWIARVSLWDALTGELVREIARLPGEVTPPTVSPDGKLLLLRGRTREICTWDLESGKRLAGLGSDVQNMYPGVCFSPDGTWIAASGPGPVELWHAACRERVGFLPSPRDRATVVFSPDSKRLYGTYGGGALMVWEVEPPRLVRTIDLHEGRTPGSADPPVAPSPDGRFVAVGGHDRTLRIFDATTFEIVHRQRFQTTPRPAWNGASTLLAVGEGPTVHVLEVGSWDELTRLLGHRADVEWIEFDDSHRRILTAAPDMTLRSWNLDRPERWPSPGGRVRQALPPRFSRDGRTLLVRSTDDASRAELWDVARKQHLRTFRPGPEMVFADLSPEGERIVAVDRKPEARLYDLASNELLFTFSPGPLELGAMNPDAVRFSPDGERISVTEGDGGLSVWDARTGACVFRVQAYSGKHIWPFRLAGAAWSSDSARILTAPGDGRVQIWDARDGKLLVEWRHGMPSVQRVQFLPDGEHVLLSGSHALGLSCWTADGARCVWSLPHEKAWTAAVSHDGTRLFCTAANNALEVRDPSTGELVVSLGLDPLLANGLAASPVDDTLVTASGTGLRIWDTRLW